MRDMSILIQGMEMPTSCNKCRFCVNGFTDDAPMYECAVQSYENVSVLVESGGKPFDFRPDWCPLIELPPHGDLVDLSDAVHPNDSMRRMTIDEQLRRTCEGWSADRKQYVVIEAEEK